MVEQKIRAIMMIEVAGRPPEYLAESIGAHINKLNSVKDVRLVNSKISKPAIVDSSKDLYSCFAEVEVETTGLINLMDLVFDFMPSSIEIIEPVDLELNCQEVTMFMNDLAGRLHKYDEVAKIAGFQIQDLKNKLIRMQQILQPSQKSQNMQQPLRVTMSADATKNTPASKTKGPKKASKKKK